MTQVQAAMFEFAISQQRRRPPSRRFYAALVLSCLSHFFALMILIEYPQLLGPGLKAWLRRPIFFTASTPREQPYRLVTVLGTGRGLQMPSDATLKTNTYDWEAHRAGRPNPPIRLKWNGDLADSSKAVDKPTPAVKPVMGTQEPKPSGDGAGTQVPAAPAADAGGAPPAVSTGAGAAGTGTTAYLPPPQPSVEPKPVPKKPPENAGMTAPSSIPGSIKPGAESASSNLSKSQGSAEQKPAAPQVFENEQKAIRSEGTGLFDTKGFPLGEYASTIIERIKGNWYIPSNLRKSQGRTTVIFFIDKDGRYTEARIVTSSGSQSLDLAALNAIIGSNPFPPLPKGFPGDHVGAKFVFSYNERP